MTRTCTICDKAIPEIRLELSPRTVTCSPDCTRQHKKNLPRGRCGK